MFHDILLEIIQDIKVTSIGIYAYTFKFNLDLNTYLFYIIILLILFNEMTHLIK